MQDRIYAINWTISQLIHKLINKPAKGYKRTLSINKIIKLGGFKNDK